MYQRHHSGGFQILEVGSLLSPLTDGDRTDGQHINFISSFLQCGKTTADRGMFQWRSDDVASKVSACINDSLNSCVIAFTGSGSENDLIRLNVEKAGNPIPRLLHPLIRGDAGGVTRVGVAKAICLSLQESVNRLLAGRRVGGIIQINHAITLIKNI